MKNKMKTDLELKKIKTKQRKLYKDIYNKQVEMQKNFKSFKNGIIKNDDDLKKPLYLKIKKDIDLMFKSLQRLNQTTTKQEKQRMIRL